MEPEGSLPHSQQPATYLYAEADRSSPCSPFPFSKIYFNIILSSTPSQDYDKKLKNCFKIPSSSQSIYLPSIHWRRCTKQARIKSLHFKQVTADFVKGDVAALFVWILVTRLEYTELIFSEIFAFRLGINGVMSSLVYGSCPKITSSEMDTLTSHSESRTSCQSI